jgi:hypothetical protein
MGPSLAELADLPLGWYAERAKVGEPWVRKKHSSDEESGRAISATRARLTQGRNSPPYIETAG